MGAQIYYAEEIEQIVRTRSIGVIPMYAHLSSLYPEASAADISYTIMQHIYEHGVSGIPETLLASPLGANEHVTEVPEVPVARVARVEESAPVTPDAPAVTENAPRRNFVAEAQQKHDEAQRAESMTTKSIPIVEDGPALETMDDGGYLLPDVDALEAQYNERYGDTHSRMSTGELKDILDEVGG